MCSVRKYSISQTNIHVLCEAVNSKTRNVCVTPTCVTAAADIIRSINTKVNPCDNFYEFSCGKWIDKHSIPDEASQINLFSLTENSIRQDLETNLASYKGKDKFVLQLITFYDSCLNTTKVDEEGSEPLKSLLDQLGGWPAIDKENEWDSEDFDWVNTTIELDAIGALTDKLFSINIDVDSKNNYFYRIIIDQPNMILGDRSLYIDSSSDIYTSYFELMVKCVIYLGRDEKTARKEMMDVLNFETQLANVNLQQTLRYFKIFPRRKKIGEMYHDFT
ncbi:Membrane metallo-endopeptidase-like 1, partial [Leptotrombidium deliense]